MSFLDRLLGKPTVPTVPTAPPAPVPVTWPPMVLVPTSLAQVSSDNELIRGFLIRDPNTNRGISQEELGELVPGAVVFHVAGISHRQDALQGPAFALGQPVRLIPEPGNPHDRNAIAVWDANGRAHIGYVPAELAAKIRLIIRGPQLYGAMVFSEIFQSSQRIALSVLLAPAEVFLYLTAELRNQPRAQRESSNF